MTTTDERMSWVPFSGGTSGHAPGTAESVVAGPETRDPESAAARPPIDLVRQFLDEIRAERGPDDVGQVPPGILDVDAREATWRTGSGDPSVHRAIGRTVLRAHESAIRRNPPSSDGPPDQSGSVSTSGTAPPPGPATQRSRRQRSRRQKNQRQRNAERVRRLMQPGREHRRAPAAPEAGAGTVGTTAVLRAFATSPRTRRSSLRPIQRARLATVFTWVQNLGAILLLFVAWQLWGTAIGEHHAQSALKQQFEAKVHSGTRPAGVSAPTGQTPDAPVQLISAARQFPNPAEGSPVAQLSIPKIDLSQIVVSGTAADDLAKGPGHYWGTALPGQAGNVAIAGHRTTHGAPFNRLAELAPGDPIYLTTTWGERLTYVVSQTPYPVSPSDTSVLDYAGDNRLTLTTCNPEFSAAQRLIVVAKLQEPVAATPAAAQPPAHGYLIASQGPAGWNWGELPWAAALVLGLIGLGVANRRLARHFDPVGRWMVLAPIWAAGLYLLFQILGNFLPAAV